MTAINFPDNPSLNDIFTVGDDSWIWTGTSWEILPDQNPSFTSITVSGTITGNVTGTVSSISNHNLNGLGDVNTDGATNQQVLAYNSSTESWNAITLTSTFTGGTIANPLYINNATVSTSSATGALRITGGVGIVDDVYVGGHLAIEDEYLNLRTRSELRFSDSDNTNYIGFKAPETVNTNLIWVLPATDGTSGQFLRTNGAGTLSWATASGGGGGGGEPGGANTQVQYNDNGVFGGSSDFVFDSGTTTVTTTNSTVTGVLTASGSTASTSTTTGAVLITGGTGIQGQLNVGGATNKFTGNTASSSTTTGTVVITGGIGVSEDIYVGANVDIATTPTQSTHAANKGYVDSTTLAFSMAFGV